MAITLAAGIDATQENVTLSAALTAQPGDLFRLGDEVVQFGGYGRIGRLPDHARKRVIFHRGVETTAAAHLSGVELLGVADALVAGANQSLPSPFAAAGAAQTVSLLGPFTFAFDTPLDVGGSWASLAELDEGTIVLRAWALFDEHFNLEDLTPIYVGISVVNAAGTISTAMDLASYANIVSGPLNVESSSFTNAVYDAEPATTAAPSVTGPIVVAKTGALLAAYSSNIPCVAGSCRIYALIATSA